MLIFRYKKLVFLFLIIASAFAANAQQDHFVYLQTDNGRPFYVKMDKKILSSSPEGYIILPNITNGAYHLKIGFPKKEYPEESFTLSLDNKNEGYLIKHFDDKGLQLFNMETLALVSGNKDTSTMAVVKTEKDANPFTQMLANVVKDSTILQNHEVVADNPAKMADTTKAAMEIATQGQFSFRDTAKAVSEGTTSSATGSAGDFSGKTKSVPSGISPSDSSAVTGKNPPISKLRSTQDKDGLKMVYADETGNETDTVSVFIPATTPSPAAGSNFPTTDNFDFAANKHPVKASADTSQLTITPTVLKPEDQKSGFVLRKDTLSAAGDTSGTVQTAPEQVFYIGAPGKETKNTATAEEGSPASPKEKKGVISDVKITGTSEPNDSDNGKNASSRIEVLPGVATSSMVNSDCKAFAGNEDFLKLRKKMASESSDEAMIKVAQKYFKSKCYSTAQIKDLSYLFLTDAGKYKFFDASYAHTSDSDQYSRLESQLKDPYYLNRFKAMIQK